MKTTGKVIALFLACSVAVISNFLISPILKSAHGSPVEMAGKILIYIEGKEFRLNLPSSNVEKYAESKEQKVDRASSRRRETDLFSEARKRLKPDTSRPLETATDLFSRDDLLKIQLIHRKVAFNEQNCEVNSVYNLRSITDEKPIDGISRNMNDIHIMANRQGTYAVVNPRYYSGSNFIILNVKKKEAVTPFCIDKLAIKDMEWSPDGRYIAFSIGIPLRSGFSSLWIYDVIKAKIIFQKKFTDRISISSIAWNPSSNAVALLIYEAGISKNPLNCCCFIPAGHPQSNIKYNLKLYNFHREIKSINVISRDGESPSGRGNVLWDD